MLQLLGERLDVRVELQRVIDADRKLLEPGDVIAATRVGASVPRAWPSAIANRCSATSWDVNAFVDATPISGPACV